MGWGGREALRGLTPPARRVLAALVALGLAAAAPVDIEDHLRRGNREFSYLAWSSIPGSAAGCKLGR